MKDDRPTRSYTRLVIAVVIIVTLTIAILVYANSPGSGTTISFPSGGTETTPTTPTTIQSSTVPSSTIEFVQESNCPYGSWVVPWAVMLDSQTVVQPSNVTLPLSYNGAHLTGDSNYSTISFSLPNGTYSYTILPDDSLGSAQSGGVTVKGSDVVVQVYAFITAMGCSSTNTATANTISLAGFSIATSGVVQPTPYLSGQIYVDAAPGVTWSGYTLYTNNTDCGTRAFNASTTLNYFAYSYQGMPCGSITPGDTYSITFVVTFTDGTNATASISVLAD